MHSMNERLGARDRPWSAWPIWPWVDREWDVKARSDRLPPLFGAHFAIGRSDPARVLNAMFDCAAVLGSEEATYVPFVFIEESEGGIWRCCRRDIPNVMAHSIDMAFEFVIMPDDLRWFFSDPFPFDMGKFVLSTSVPDAEFAEDILLNRGLQVTRATLLSDVLVPPRSGGTNAMSPQAEEERGDARG